MRPFREIFGVLLIRDQLMLGWKITFFIVCAALVVGSMTLARIKVRAVDISGTVTSFRSEGTESGRVSYLILHLDNGEDVEALTVGPLSYRPGRRAVARRVTTNFFGFKKYEFKGYIEGKSENQLASRIETMSRIALEDFDGEETARIYLAISLAEAKSVEAELNNHAMDYAVEVEPYHGGLLVWFTVYKGAAFYVRESQAEFCRELLRSAALTAGLLREEYQ